MFSLNQPLPTTALSSLKIQVFCQHQVTNYVPTSNCQLQLKYQSIAGNQSSTAINMLLSLGKQIIEVCLLLDDPSTFHRVIILRVLQVSQALRFGIKSSKIVSQRTRG
jgi:ArsR family metal-binding transcriptional regulator